MNAFVESEVRRSDRRAATCVENLFFKAKKLTYLVIFGPFRSLSTGIRKVLTVCESFFARSSGGE